MLEVVTSDLASEEARRNIVLKRPMWLPAFDRLVERVSVVGSARFDLGVPLTCEDVPVLCAAVRAKCDCLVTGDKRDFGHLCGRVVKGVRVVMLAELARLLAGRRGDE